MTSTSNPLFAEKSLTLVAALFVDKAQAAGAVKGLKDEHPQVLILEPNDKQWMRKLEPEGKGIWRGAVRSHATLMLTGFLLGILLSYLLVRHWPAAAASPWLTSIAVTLFSTFAGGLLAGLVTLRPDRSAVALQVKEGLKKGRWAVVAHPRTEKAAKEAAEVLRSAGGEVLRSL